MPPGLLFALIVIASLLIWLIEAAAPISNVSVIGAVFCDACSSNTFTKHSYFLPGAKVLVECKFRPNSTSREDISIRAYRMTDSIGMYRLDIPPVDGFDCREGREIESACRASLVGSSSSLCNIPGLSSSTEHVAVKCKEASICIFNLNALNFRPSRKDGTLCGTSSTMQLDSNPNFNTSLFFWPPFGFPWPKWLPFPFPSPPSFPFPFPSPPSLPFPFPPIPFFTPPPSFPFPFPFTPAPGPPSFPIPLPPSLFPPSPPPPAFPFPFPPLPSLPPFPPLFAQRPPPPSPPPPAIPIQFPPFPQLPPFPPLFPSPGQPSPPPAFSLSDPRTWFPFYPPIPKDQPQSEKP